MTTAVISKVIKAPLETTEVRTRISAITSLRFFAAAMIVLRHWSENKGWGIENIIALDQGVSFFFVLSGFVLLYSYREGLTSRENLIGFWIGRLGRVWPAHLVGLLVLVTCLPAAAPHGLLIALANISLLQSWIPKSTYYYALNAPSWSISVECFFYALFPLLLWNWNKNWGYKIAGVTLIAVGMLMFCTYLHWHGTHTPTRLIYQAFLYVSPLSRLFEFVIGMSAAQVFFRLQKSRISASMSSCIELLVLVAIATNLFVSTLYANSLPSNAIAYWMRYCSGAPLYAGLLVVAAIQKGVVSRTLLSAKPLVFLGEISYSIFVFHWILLQIMQKYSASVKLFRGDFNEIFAYCFALFVTSAASYYFVERPVRRYVRNFSMQFKKAIN
jgi:peptidoglycan/LPS O-acetylase OafA/YrhL